MIGGDDIWVPHLKTTTEHRSFVLHAFRSFWPHAIVSIPHTPLLSIWASQLNPPPRCTEFAIYQDAASADAWEREGWNEDYADCTVLVIFEADCISFVLEDRNTNVGCYVQEIAKGLDALRLGISNYRQAA